MKASVRKETLKALVCIIIVIKIILPVCPGTMTCIYCIIITFIGSASVAQDSLQQGIKIFLNSLFSEGYLQK